MIRLIYRIDSIDMFRNHFQPPLYLGRLAPATQLQYTRPAQIESLFIPVTISKPREHRLPESRYNCPGTVASHESFHPKCSQDSTYRCPLCTFCSQSISPALDTIAWPHNPLDMACPPHCRHSSIDRLYCDWAIAISPDQSQPIYN